ncbi:MAG: flagellar basal body rod protein FlgC [Pyrinomonadaceae bacterium]|nr:flagellar basal body rod protein FlgC [Pyrinomonadaceae bacterium]
MSLINVFQISSQGMSAQRERLEAAASNLANSNTTRTAEGGSYRRRDVFVEAIEARTGDSPFGSSQFGSAAARAGRESNAQGVQATTIVAAQGEGIKRYMPAHPDADKDGYVMMPDVDPLEETVNMLSAARAFEANATAFNTAKEMARTSLRLGDV